MIRFLRGVGNRSLDRLASVGRAMLVFAAAMWRLPRLSDVPLIIKQIYQVGVLSLVIVVLVWAIIGLCVLGSTHAEADDTDTEPVPVVAEAQ